MPSKQKDFVHEHLKMNSFNEDYALATIRFFNRTQTKKNEIFFSFLSFFDEICRSTNGIYRKNAHN
jgi:hypothetical protein